MSACDLRQAAVRVMVSSADSVRPVLVRMLVRGVVPVVVVIVVVVVVGVRSLGGLPFDHPELRRRHAGAQHALGRDVVAVDGQTAQRRAKPVERDPRVEQRAQNHVAGGAVEAVEVENSHGPKRQL